MGSTSKSVPDHPRSSMASRDRCRISIRNDGDSGSAGRRLDDHYAEEARPEEFRPLNASAASRKERDEPKGGPPSPEVLEQEAWTSASLFARDSRSPPRCEPEAFLECRARECRC